jgi:large subunit ribosomal protein L1
VKVQEALAELKKEKERKFDQTVELIVNLRAIDVKRDQVNTVVSLPHKIKDKKVCAFLTEKSKIVDSITEGQFAKYAEKDALKKLVKDYDYFISVAKLMPKVATNFGKVLGPVGKMPSPQLGILPQENETAIKAVLEKINSSLKVRMKEASFKVVVGKQSMDEEKVMENIKVVYRALENALPKKKENVKNVMVKLTMSKPLKVEVTQ